MMVLLVYRVAQVNQVVTAEIVTAAGNVHVRIQLEEGMERLVGMVVMVRMGLTVNLLCQQLLRSMS